MKLDTLLVLLTLWVPVAWCSGSARRRRFHCRGRAATLNRDEGVYASVARSQSNRAG